MLIAVFGPARAVAEPLGEQFGECRDSRLYALVVGGNQIGGQRRLLYCGVDVAVIDPEDEYARLTRAVGGALIRLGAPGVHLNPLDLPAGASRTRDAITRRQLFCHTLIGVLLGEPLGPTARTDLDRALVDCHAAAGISHDPRTLNRPAPLLADLAATLDADERDPAARELAARLAPYVSGTWRHLFEAPTTARPEGHLVTFSLREIPEELKTVGTLLTAARASMAARPPRPRRPAATTISRPAPTGRPRRYFGAACRQRARRLTRTAPPTA